MRSFWKTVTFAVLHFMVGFGIAYLLSGSLVLAFGIALLEPAINTLVFYVHERAWEHIPLPGAVS